MANYRFLLVLAGYAVLIDLVIVTMNWYAKHRREHTDRAAASPRSVESPGEKVGAVRL